MSNQEEVVALLGQILAELKELNYREASRDSRREADERARIAHLNESMSGLFPKRGP
jgi:hypothetical protein